ncbi:MAG: choice-of-anchor A family protein, partial [Fimbriimonadaceae bacterium]|nr:choice-of-anchor A family protein [Fimbriimonadaceae bacterium]
TVAFAGDLGVANGFNAFIFENANTTGGHSEGAMAVGGNWAQGYESFQHNNPFPTVSGFANAGVLVGGNVNVSGVSRLFRGNAYVGGSVSGGSIDIHGGGSTITGNQASIASVFNAQKAYSLSQSQYLASLTGASINISDPNNINLNLGGNNLNGNLKVYNVNASQLSSLSTFNLSGGNGSETVVVNVHGTNVDWGWQVNYGSKNRLLWNFVDATNINVHNRNLDGSILAVNAHVSQRQNIQGNLIAKSWTNQNGAELHFGNQFRFAGSVPPPPVPEPASMAVLGMGALAFLRRRKSK